MPLTFNSISSGTDWAGSSWEVVDDEKLAELIARVAMGQSRYVRRVLTELNVAPQKGFNSALDGAIKLLTAPDPDVPWHRDGWMFQVISWIASHLQGLADIISQPHTIHAHKGFDGLHVKLDPKKETVTLVVVCEEKATKNPRQMVGNNVWKEFEGMQLGERDHQLADQVTQLLETSAGIDVDAAVQKIMWADARAYRVSLTIDDEFNSGPGYIRLFKGYPDVVKGGVQKRRSEVFYLADMRDWMDKLANKAIGYAKKMDKQ